MNYKERKANEEFFHNAFSKIKIGGFYLWESEGHIFYKTECPPNSSQKWTMNSSPEAIDHMATHVRPSFMKHFKTHEQALRDADAAKQAKQNAYEELINNPFFNDFPEDLKEKIYGIGADLNN